MKKNRIIGVFLDENAHTNCLSTYFQVTIHLE